MDFNSVPPAVENLILRAVAQGKFPRINTVVDTCNIVSLRNLIPLGVFDKDQIDGKICLTFPGIGVNYLPIAGSQKEIKNQRMLVLRDDSKIISIPCYRDSEFTKITEKTKNIIIVSVIVDGIDKDETGRVIEEAKENLLQN